ncbi:cysteine desulfurase family protein [Pseudalkalibacillus caeni]|uniref:cysteine desulfurase n=1 Tax=Exobacillus caeni TaxID=2574798 RepID=A0A5R9F9V2_9BACL|nr:cysteine desulfurase family protein [Pseudalkalibacillus caeni]TLS39289.1 cysteine desulfurase [Pseudalkalibacillus caeni]
MEAIYLDHAATSPVHPDVVEVMIPSLKENFGNPSSIHRFGRSNRHVLDEARSTIASSVGAHPKEIVFTSGGTEADNMAIIGTAMANKDKGKHIITSQVEHHAVLHACEHLETLGYEVTYLPVNKEGRVSVEELKAALREDTVLVTVMYGNNEVGTVQPIKEIGELLQERNITFHTDAVQAYGLLDIDVTELSVDLMSVSAHKINGPKGIGFLYVKEKTNLAPFLYGGEQERKRRAGTENVAGIVGFEKAVQIMQAEKQKKTELYLSFQKEMLAVFGREGIDYKVNGDPEHYLPHILNVSFPGVSVESLLTNLDLAGIAVSSGSACTAGSLEPSHVLTAMHGETDRAFSAVRFSFGLGNTTEQVTKAAEETVKVVKRLKAL